MSWSRASPACPRTCRPSPWPTAIARAWSDSTWSDSRRNGFTQEQRNRIKDVYRLVLRSGLRLAEALVRAEQEYPGPETTRIVQFIQSSRRGVISYA